MCIFNTKEVNNSTIDTFITDFFLTTPRDSVGYFMNLSFFPRALFPLAGGLKPLVFSSCLHVGGAGRRSRVREFANGATCRTRREGRSPPL